MASRARHTPLADLIRQAELDAYKYGWEIGYTTGYNEARAGAMVAGRREGLIEALDVIEAYGAKLDPAILKRVTDMLESLIKGIGETPPPPPAPEPPEFIPAGTY